MNFHVNTKLLKCHFNVLRILFAGEWMHMHNVYVCEDISVWWWIHVMLATSRTIATRHTIHFHFDGCCIVALGARIPEHTNCILCATVDDDIHWDIRESNTTSWMGKLWSGNRVRCTTYIAHNNNNNNHNGQKSAGRKSRRSRVVANHFVYAPSSSSEQHAHHEIYYNVQIDALGLHNKVFLIFGIFTFA